MDINRIKDIDTYLEKSKYTFIYFYDDWCNEQTEQIDNYFKNKYDLNKMYLKVHIKNKKIIEHLQVTYCPCIQIYNKKIFIKDIECNQENTMENINKNYIILD